MRASDAEAEFLLATRDLEASATLQVLKNIYTVPPADGRTLYDLIVRNRYKRVLDVGTGRGASALWMALATLRTGGKVTTIEFNPIIAESARANFERSSEVCERIELVVGDARRELDRLQGNFDMVFIDIGSEDAKLLFEPAYERVVRGGTIAVHDVLRGGAETDYVRLVRRRPGLQTTLHRVSDRGLAVSTKR